MLAYLFCGFVVGIGILEFRLVLLLVINKINGRAAGKEFWSKPALLVHFVAAVGAICIAYGYFIEPYWIEVSPVTVRTEKLGGETLRIVQLTDMHCDLKERNEKRIVEVVNSLEPDVIVFTGDAVNDNRTIGRFKDTLKQLEAKIGKVAIWGNIDLWHQGSQDFFSGTDFEVLDKGRLEFEKNGERFTISGLRYDRQGEYRQLLKENREDELNILLYHTPDLIEDLDGLNVDLYLAGHTHGGQVALPFYGALITFSKYGKKYEAGRYEVSDTTLYVSRGLGMEGGRAPRVRFCARPEIVVIDIGK